jgi:hypothetical protein
VKALAVSLRKGDRNPNSHVKLSKVLFRRMLLGNEENKIGVLKTCQADNQYLIDCKNTITSPTQNEIEHNREDLARLYPLQAVAS